MRRMRQQVTENNIYRWAGSLLSEGGKLLGAAPCPHPLNGAAGLLPQVLTNGAS